MSQIINKQNRLRELAKSLIEANTAGDVELAETIQDEIWEIEEDLNGETIDHYNDLRRDTWR